MVGETLTRWVVLFFGLSVPTFFTRLEESHNKIFGNMCELLCFEIFRWRRVCAGGLCGTPASVAEAVLVKSEAIPEGTKTVRGYDFEGKLDVQALLDSMLCTVRAVHS